MRIQPLDSSRPIDSGMVVPWIPKPVSSAESLNPIPAVVDAGAKAGWSIASVAREHKSLQRVFSELQDRAGGEA